MQVPGVGAVCCCEVQRVLTSLRANRRFQDLSRGWRELEDDSPVRLLASWRHEGDGLPIQPLLSIIRSHDTPGVPTCTALEAVYAILVALMESSAGVSRQVLSEVVASVCDCKFEDNQTAACKTIGFEGP